jgi:hypothetical protein
MTTTQIDTQVPTELDAVRDAAIELALANRYDAALRLLDATGPSGPRGRLLLALTAADVADRAGHGASCVDAPARFAELDAAMAAYEPDPVTAWDIGWLRVRRAYSQSIRHADGSYRMGPEGRDPDEVSRLVDEATRLRDAAPDDTRRGWASMCLGWTSDNVLADRDAAPGHYQPALDAARSGADDLLLFEAQRHLGDHAHDDRDLVDARERWQESTAAGMRAGHVGGVLSQELLLAVLHRDEGDEAGGRAIAGEVLRWASAIGAVGLVRQAEGFLAGVDPTRPPDDE